MGRRRFTALEAFRVPSPRLGEHKFPQRLTRPWGQFPFTKRLRKCGDLSLIPDGDSRYGFIACRKSIAFANGVRKNPGHLMDHQVHGCCLHDQISHSQTDVMIGMAVDLSIMIKVEFCHREQKERSPFRPDLIAFHQTTQKLLMAPGVLDCRENENPGRFVKTGGSPSCRFQQALDFLSFYRLIGKRSWTPATT